MRRLDAAMAPIAKSAILGLSATADAPCGRPSTLPKASEPPGALSCECKAVLTLM